MVRISKALDEPPRMLAANLGMPYSELEPLLDDKHKIAGLDEDEVWWRLSEYLDRKLGLIMAARNELQHALHKDREARAVRLAAMRARERKGSPRGR